MMERITLLYGSYLWDGITFRTPISEWLGEFFALEKTGMFHIAFFNYNDFMRGEKLEVATRESWPSVNGFSLVNEAQRASSLKPKKRNNPTILRCPYMDEEHYARLERELPRFGYRLISDNWESHEYARLRHWRGLSTDCYMIASASAGCSFGSGGYDSLQPTIYLARDEEGPADVNRCKDFFVTGWVTAAESKRLADEFAEYRGGAPTDEVFFEKYLPYSVYGGSPVAWRVFYFDGVPFYKGRIWKSWSDLHGIPEPSSEVLSAFAANMGAFGSCDLVLAEGGGWKCSRIMDGQFTSVPLGGDEQDFADAFVKVVAESPHVSESWCLTARMKDENTIGEDHHIVHGTRHFAPGTKVWLHAPNWLGRVGAIGVPRYSSNLVRVVMDVRKLENFGVEMVHDKEILAGLAYPYRAWPFTKLAPIGTFGDPWNESDESRETILGYIDWLEELTQAEE